jgi:hypothetical protein
MEATVCTAEVGLRQGKNERLELFALQCRLLATRADRGIAPDPRSVSNLERLSDELNGLKD